MRRLRNRRKLLGAAKASPGRFLYREELVTRSLRLPDSVDQALKRRAEADDRSANKTVVQLLRQALAEEIKQLAEEQSAADAEEDDADEAID